MLSVTMWMLIPNAAFAQGGFADEVKSLHAVLEKLYDEMLPLCSKLISVGRGIAGFAATWYIASRIWRHIANAEPIDFYPLFRPFVLGFAVLFFPSVISMINGVMQPTVRGTASMVVDSDKAISILLKKKKKQSNKQLYGKCMLVKQEVAIGINGISIHILMITAHMKDFLKALVTIFSSQCQKHIIIFETPSNNG